MNSILFRAFTVAVIAVGTAAMHMRNRATPQRKLLMWASMNMNRTALYAMA